MDRIEDGEKAVARVICFKSVEPVKAFVEEGIVSGKNLRSQPVAETLFEGCRADDIGKEADLEDGFRSDRCGYVLSHIGLALRPLKHEYRITIMLRPLQANQGDSNYGAREKNGSAGRDDHGRT